MCEDKKKGEDNTLGQGRRHSCGHGAREGQRYLKIKPPLEDFTQHCREQVSPLSVCHVSSGKLTFVNGAGSDFFVALRRWKLPRRCVILRCLTRDLPEILTELLRGLSKAQMCLRKIPGSSASLNRDALHTFPVHTGVDSAIVL